jgi:hypothetical protein
VQPTLERLVVRSLNVILNDITSEELDKKKMKVLEEDVEKLQRLMTLGKKLNLGLVLYQAQEVYFNFLHKHLLSLSLTSIIEEKEPEKLGEIHSEFFSVYQKNYPLLKLG